MYTRHYQTGTLFDEATDDTARTRTMVLMTYQGPSDANPRPIVSGVYHDQWHKTSAGWRFAHRLLRHDLSTRSPIDGGVPSPIGRSFPQSETTD